MGAASTTTMERVVNTKKNLSQASSFNSGECPRLERASKRAHAQRRASCPAKSAAYQPEILPVSLALLSKLPRACSTRAALITALLDRQLEEHFMNRRTTDDDADGDSDAAAMNESELTPSAARAQLAWMMPFHRWCASLNPTETAKELYLFVRTRLKMRAAEGGACADPGASARVKRSRALKARNAAATLRQAEGPQA